MPNNPPITAKSIDTGCGCLSYCSAPGSSNAPTTVLLHGLSANHTTWEATLVGLAQNGYAALAPDLRGHGHSDKRKVKACYTLDRFSQDLAEILKQEKIERPLLVGYSFGGSIALDFAQRFPDSLAGLVLISANHHNPFEYWGIKRLTFLGRAFLNGLAWLFLWQGRRRYRYYRPDGATGYWQSVWQGFGTMPWSVNFWLVEQLLRLDFRHRLSLQVPVWILHAPDDPFLSKAELADLKKALPQARFLPSDHPGHFIASQNQDGVTKFLLSILDAYENRPLH